MKNCIILLVLLVSFINCSQKNKLSSFNSENKIKSIPKDTLVRDSLIIDKLSKDKQAYQDFKEWGCSLCYEKYSTDSAKINFENTSIDLFNSCEQITPKKTSIGFDSVKCHVFPRLIDEKTENIKYFFENYIKKESGNRKLTLETCKDLFNDSKLKRQYEIFINNRSNFMRNIYYENDYLNFGYAKVYTE